MTKSGFVLFIFPLPELPVLATVGKVPATLQMLLIKVALVVPLGNRFINMLLEIVALNTLLKLI